MPFLSMRAYARHRGVSLTSVQKALATGRIRKNGSGKIDSAAADRSWEANTDPSKPRNSVTGNPRHKRPRGGPSLPMGYREEPVREASGSGDHIRSGYSQAATIQKTYQAKREKLAFEKEAGILVSADETHSNTFKLARATRDRMLGIPARLASVLAAIADASEVQRLLEEAIIQACAEIASLPSASSKAAS